MLEVIRKQLIEKLESRSTAGDKMDEVLAGVEARDATDLTEDETKVFNEARDECRALDKEIEALKERKGDIEEKRAKDAERETLARELQPEETRAERQTIVTGGNEPSAYARGNGASFFNDVYAAKMGMATRASQERLTRHENEVRSGVHGDEYRDVATGGMASLVVPQYLPEMFAEFLRAGRVTANLASGHNLPDEGMNITIPRAVTGTLVAEQATENTAVTSRDHFVTDLVVPVCTYAGQQNVSRQAVERGRGTDEIIYADLAGAYSVALDSDVIAGPGSGNRHLGIIPSAGTSVDSTTTATGAAGLIKNLADAIQRVNGTRFLPADVVVMHPRRWGWLVSQSDSNGRPLVLPAVNAPQNAWGQGDAPAYGFVGQVLGLPVYTDANIPSTSTGTGGAATKDVIIVAKRSDLHLWEDGVAPRKFRFEETLGGNLTIKLVAAAYSAFTARHHPEGVAIISGTGLVPPTF